jgi:hypothetical protein
LNEEFPMMMSPVLSQAMLRFAKALCMTLLIAPIAHASHAQDRQPNVSEPNVSQPAVQPEMIKYELDMSGKHDEWVRIEVTGDVAKLLHTRVGPSGATTMLNSLLSAVSTVVPAVRSGPNLHRWYDHKTTHVAFKPDGCMENTEPPPTCLITGVDTLTLPAGSHIRNGLISIEYEDRNLLRSVTFRLPAK